MSDLRVTPFDTMLFAARDLDPLVRVDDGEFSILVSTAQYDLMTEEQLNEWFQHYKENTPKPQGWTGK